MTVGRQEIRKLSITISSGTGTGNISRIWAISRRVRIIPVAETDTYDVTVKDPDGDLVIKRTSQLGTFSEIQELSLGSVGSVLIENASQDGTYTVKFDMH